MRALIKTDCGDGAMARDDLADIAVPCKAAPYGWCGW